MMKKGALNVARHYSTKGGDVKALIGKKTSKIKQKHNLALAFRPQAR